MSFQTTIRAIMTSVSNGALALLPDGASSVKYVHLPEDFDFTKSWLVYDFSVSNNVGSMNNSCAYSEYQLLVTATTNDSMKTNDLSDALISYLDGLSYFTLVAEISFVSDQRTTSLNKSQNIYQNTMTFNVVYTG